MKHKILVDNLDDRDEAYRFVLLSVFDGRASII